MSAFWFSNEEKLDFSDVLLVPQKGSGNAPASREGVSLIINGHVPIIVANMDSIGTFEMASHLKEAKMLVALLKDYTVEQWLEAVKEYNLDPSLLIPTIGVRGFDNELEKIKGLYSNFNNIPFVSMDVPNAYLGSVCDAVKKFKEKLPNVKLSVGNVVTPEGVKILADSGADMIKLGIGSGGVCLTRKMTGAGYPQFSAILDCVEQAKVSGVKLISDGGITCAGDMVKAFAGGAAYVMAGSYFAGHEETGLVFHGMSSHRSRTERGEQIVDYRASEGREVLLKNKGSIQKTIRELLGGIRSGCTLVGMGSLEELMTHDIPIVRVRRQINPIEGVAVHQHS
jgi:GMP reductase